METIITNELTDAVMPDNEVQSTTETAIQNEQSQAEAELAEPQQEEVVAPVSYQLDVPQGYYLSDDTRTEFTQLAQQFNLNNDAANALVKLHLKQMDAATREKESQVADRAAEYERASRQDKEIGGAKFERSLQAARRALQAYGSAGLINVLNETGLGNHPDVIRLFAKIGGAMSEGRYVTGEQAARPAEKTLAQKIYGM